MKLAAFLAPLLILSTPSAHAQSDIQRSHIEANVPPPQEFERLLQRDLISFFKQKVDSTVTSVEVEPLRSGATQSGVSYPKFYLWVKVLAGSTVQQAGAVRVAAINRTGFEVTHYMPVSIIKEKPSTVGEVFPAALVSGIRDRAAVR